MKFKDKMIFDVLDLDIGEVVKFFENFFKIYYCFLIFVNVGLDYLKFG